MRILLVTQYFWPENFIINNLVKTLSKQGHQIKILTGKPNYPDGKIYPGYNKKNCMHDTFIETNDIFRIPLKPRGRATGYSLFLNYVSFVINGIRFFPKAITNQQYDIILAVGLSPITSVIPAMYLKKKLNIPLTLWLQDLWPESVKATGYIKNNLLLKLLAQLVKQIYKKCDLILMQSNAFKPFILKLLKNSTEKKLIYYPNSIECYSKSNIKENLPLSLIKTFNENFCLVFTGNVGEAQDIQTWIATIKLLTHLKNFRLIIIGSGSSLENLNQAINKEKLEQLITIGALPYEQMPHVYKRAHGLLVTLKTNNALQATIPSKVQAYLAAGKPIIAALDGEGKKIITEAKAGFVAPCSDCKALAKNISKLYYMTEKQREDLGGSGKKYFYKNFEMQAQAKKLTEILKSVM